MRALPALALVACLSCAGAYARQTDSTQPILVNADSLLTSQDKEITTLTGNVRIDQGTMHLDGAKGVGNFDQDNALEHAVLTGSPAHMRQQMDDGSWVHGQANTIDYTVADSTIVLTGDAVVVHEGQGETHAAKITYNSDSGQMQATSTSGGQVHMILQPTKKAAPATKVAASASAKPAPASTTAKPAPASTTAKPASASTATMPAALVSTKSTAAAPPASGASD